MQLEHVRTYFLTFLRRHFQMMTVTAETTTISAVTPPSKGIISVIDLRSTRKKRASTYAILNTLDKSTHYKANTREVRNIVHMKVH